jgi:hypothetical protein
VLEPRTDLTWGEDGRARRATDQEQFVHDTESWTVHGPEGTGPQSVRYVLGRGLAVGMRGSPAQRRKSRLLVLLFCLPWLLMLIGGALYGAVRGVLQLLG